MRMPFNALQRRYVPGPTGRSAIRELASRPGVYLLDEHAFDEFERPELFYDLHHLNATGRERFSTKFARLFGQAFAGETR
jgi:hypothetical protein